MKNRIFTLLVVLLSTIAFAQNPKVESINYKKQFTLAERDALSLGVNDRKQIYVVDTGVNEVQIWDGDSWESLSGSNQLQTVTIDAATYTLQEADILGFKQHLIASGQTDVTITIPELSYNLSTDEIIYIFIYHEGTGNVTVEAGTNVTFSTTVFSDKNIVLYSDTDNTWKVKEIGSGGLSNPLTENLDTGGYSLTSDDDLSFQLDTDNDDLTSNFLIATNGGARNLLIVDEQGYSSFGQQDSDFGWLRLYGDADDVSGGLQLYNPASYDTNLDNYIFRTLNGNLILLANGGVNGSSTPLLTFNSSTLQTGFGNYEFPRADGTAGQVLTTDGSGQVTFEDVTGGYTITADDITIPSNIYACVGFEANIYYDALVPCFDNGLATKTNVEIICDKGTAWHDRWALTATSPDVGTETLTINVYDDNNDLLATKSVTLNIVEDSGDLKNANILMIGDSLTFAGSITNTLRTSLETFANINPNFYGTQGTAPNNQEGRGGWAFSTFVGTGSPFWSGSAIDVSYYRNTTLSSAPVFDIVTIQLGVNDSFDNDVKSAAEITAIIDDAKTLIDAFIADSADTKIIVQLPTLCANTLDGWGDDYGATRKRNNYKKNIFLLRKEILSEFDDAAYNMHVYVGQAGLSVDRYYGYPRSSGNPATRLTGDTVERHTNALHPTTGYPQIADGILGQVLTYIELLSSPTNVVTNGDFSSGLTSWTNATGDWADGGGYAELDGTNPANTTLAQNGILTNAVTYEVTYDLTISSGSVRARCGFSGTGTLRTTSGTYTENITCSGNTNFDFLAVTGTTCTIDNVVVTPL